MAVEKVKAAAAVLAALGLEQIYQLLLARLTQSQSVLEGRVEQIAQHKGVLLAQTQPLAPLPLPGAVVRVEVLQHLLQSA